MTATEMLKAIIIITINKKQCYPYNVRLEKKGSLNGGKILHALWRERML